MRESETAAREREWEIETPPVIQAPRGCVVCGLEPDGRLDTSDALVGRRATTTGIQRYHTGGESLSLPLGVALSDRGNCPTSA